MIIFVRFCVYIEYDDIEFKQLKPIACVGVGGFGRVIIVKYGRDDNFKVFALKQMKKIHIVETKQEEHVFNERRIMMSCKLNEIDFFSKHFLTLSHTFIQQSNNKE
jgi:cGMP-dependent protein kinase 1